MSRLIGTREAAQRLGIHHFSVCRVIRQGRLKGTKIGRTWVVDEEDVDDLVKSYEPRRGRPWKKDAKRRQE